MKTVLTLVLSLVVISLFISPGTTWAAANDTLVVYASGPSLDVVFGKDTTQSGLQAHSVYKLVSLDTTYIYLGAVSVNSSITVIGVLGSNGRPPCIQPGVLSDNSVPTVLFNLNGQATTGVFQNLYITDLSISNTWTGAKDFFVSANYVKLYLDNVIVDENHYEVIAFNGIGDDIFVTNCKFRNGIDPTNWFGSSIVAVDYPSNTPADSIVMRYNTFLCVNSRAITTGNNGPVNYCEFTHNSYVYNFTEDLRMFSVVKGKFDDNIFYSLYAGAQPVAEYSFWFEPFSPETNSIIDFDTLTVSMDSVVDPADVANANLRLLAEGKRNIEVKNNVYFWATKLTNFWTAWDDTARGADSLYTAPWMNNRTTNMFSDKTHWPNLTQSGNQMADPGFGSSVLNVIDNANATPGVVGLTKYVTEIRSGTETTDVWGYEPQTVSGTNWIPVWPLPEQTTADLKYSASLTAPDGLPYGDPYWFTLTQTAVKEKPAEVATVFSLAQNYPNPFNPSTQIDFSIPQQSNVQLKVYNTLGQVVATLVNGNLSAGSHSVNFDARNLASGMYIYRLSAGNYTSVKKMMLLK